MVATSEQAAVDQKGPLGAAQGPWPFKGQPMGRPRSTAPRTFRALSVLATQRSPARPLPAPSASRRRAPSRLVALVGAPLPHPCVRQVIQDDQDQPRPDPRGGRAWPIELKARGTQQQDPANQPPWLRPPQRGRFDLDDLPLLWRNHRP